MSPRALLLPCAAAMALAAAPAFAQGEPAADDLFEQTYGQWTLRCMTRENAAPCDISHALRDSETGAQLAAVSVSYSAALEATAVQIIVPLGVHLPNGLNLTAGELEVPGARYARCELHGCFVEARLGEDMVDAMRAADVLQLVMALTAGRSTTIELSLSGFGAAYDALVEETAERTPAEAPDAE